MDDTSSEERSVPSGSVSANNGVESASVSSGSNYSVNGNDDFFFGKYCRHVPRVLRHQLISKLVNQYIYKMKSTDADGPANRVHSKQGDPGVDFKANTSIYRFHGALLFVDISGFTVLSQKLKVDDLKNQINAYFQKIVDIINKYDGEIIKFAGDALFIIWQTKVNDTNDPRFLAASKDAVDKAVTCGVEINTECSSYAITLKTSGGDSKKVNDLIQSMNVSHGLFEGTKAPPAQAEPTQSSKTSPRGGGSAKGKRKRRGPTVTYLNVHAGVSMGVMAGMDVGANNRFEYLLLGRPMNEVAIAEGDAGTGEIVISPAVHALLHNYASLKTSGRGGALGVPAVEDSSHPLSCGCTRTGSGFYKIRNSLGDMLCAVDFGAGGATDGSAAAATVCVVPAEAEFEGNSDLQYEFEVYAQVIEELMSGYKAISPALQTQFAGVLQNLSGTPADEEMKAAEGQRAAIEYTEKEVMMEHFFAWAQHCLLDDIAKHVHEVVRKGYSFYQERRAAPFEHFLSSPACIESFRNQLERTHGVTYRNSTATRHMSALTVGSASASSPHSAHSSVSSHHSSASAHASRSQVGHHSGSHGSPHAHSSSGTSGSRAHGDSFVSKMRQLTGLSTLREKKQTKHQQVLSKDGTLVSELRNVIVLFISVKIDNAGVFLDPLRDSQAAQAGSVDAENIKMVQTCKVDSFHFLSRTVDEIEADKKLINQFQGCMEVLTDVFHTKGGQLRQFIVDDKGTVAIGTFGLRGSVNYDNAAAAVDAADLIVARLQMLGFNASVGVTSGAAYCGLVGSDTRHEYAVMGPSTNLSARLMGRAQEGEIICDSAIRQRDRAHTYTSLGAVKAKGYANLVPIFKPEFITNTAAVPYEPTDTAPAAAAPKLALRQPSKLKMEVSGPLSDIYGRKKEITDMFKFLFHDTVKGDLEELTDAFWKPAGVESQHKTALLLHDLHPHEIDSRSHKSSRKSQPGSSKKRKFAFHQDVQKGRFDISRKHKKTVIISPNGMGKTALLNLFHCKLDALIRKNKRMYNIAVFRHQVGYINPTALFSAWYCLVRQTLFSIAETVAESGDAQAAQCLEAVKDDDCGPVVAFLCDYLPPELRPFTPLLALVGIKQRASQPSEQPERVMSDGEGELGDTDIESPDVSPPDSGKTDPVSTLDPAEKLQRCADLIVAIVQLHVKLTRKLTVFIMDDLQHHDPASQDMGRVLARTVTGVCVICTYRTSQAYSSLSGDPAHVQAPSPSSPAKGPVRLFDNTAFSSYEQAMMTIPTSNEFRRTELPPLSKTACKQLLVKIFNTFGVPPVHDGVLDTLHSLSAGSPLYATELAKTVCDRYINRACTLPAASKGHQHHQGDHAHKSAEMAPNSACSVQLGMIIDDLRTDRIEEIVHFRFDKLTEQCQLVLKMAAVASVSGAHFTLSMLTYIIDSSDNSESAKLDAMVHNTKMLLGYLSDGDNEDSHASAAQRVNPLHNSMDLVQAINDLLESDEFIEFRGDLSRPILGTDDDKAGEGGGSSYTALMQLNAMTPVTPKPDLSQLMNDTNVHLRASSRDRSALQQLRFHWKVDMELRAIYDLMLDEQKESLHDRVASYLEQDMEKRDDITATEWAQQGFHWERATNWSSAMTCYYQAGMLLREQGDALGCKSCFTEAFRMLDKMRHDAGVSFLEGHSALRTAVEPAFPAMAAPAVGSCAVPVFGTTPVPRTEEEIRALATAGFDYILCGRNSGLRPEDIYKMFEGSSQLFSTGMAVLVRLAQTLIGPGTTDLSYRLFEDALDIVHILKSSPEPLTAADGEPFGLIEKDLCFPTISGMFLLLLNDQVEDINKNSRCIALISLAMQLAKSKPEYEVHLVHAYIMKIRLMERFMYQDPSMVPHILSYADELMRLYNRDKHSKALIYYYNSDRVANSLGVAVKVLCMQGRFYESLKYLDAAKHMSTKLKRFFSQAMGLCGVYSPILLYFPDSQAQLIYDKFMQDSIIKQSKEFEQVAPLLSEAISQVLKLAQFEATGDENIFDSDSTAAEDLIQSRALVQVTEVKFALNMLRIYSVAMEYVAARVCYFKALRYDKLQSLDAARAAQHRAKAAAYLQLGLDHLIFVAEQTVRNETYVFSDLHEKLLRAQLLMKSVEYCDSDGVDTIPTANASVSASASADSVQGSGERRAQLWQQALENLQYCAAVARRGGFHAISLQAGAHMQILSALSKSADNNANDALRAEGLALQQTALHCIKEHNDDSVDLEAVFKAMMITVA